jgi:predicted nuclease of restriction endonuclease-like RecB superfamily
VSAVEPAEARWRVFHAASASPADRTTVLASVARGLNVTAEELETALFSDLRGERRVPPLPRDLSPPAFATRVNLALATSLIRRAATVRITAYGNSRALVRHARLLGLICNVEALPNDQRRAVGDGLSIAGISAPTGDESSGVTLNVSGPLALFHHTEVYGRALASLVPRLAWCHEFELVARCAMGRGSHLSTFVLRSGDPISTGRELIRYDSKLEERFAREFSRIAPNWDLIREPHPVDVGGALAFPDFELVHRHDPERRWLLEIVGFWTAAYLNEKLRHLRSARLERLILCIDDRRRCREDDLPEHAQVIRYKKKIDPRAVLAKIGA